MKRLVASQLLCLRPSTRKMSTPRRGEVWLIDFGMAGKTRPALVVSVAFDDQDRAPITVVPHTTSLRGSPFEIAVPAPFLKPGAFIYGSGRSDFCHGRGPLHRLGVLSPAAFEKVIGGLLLAGTFSRGLTGQPARASSPWFHCQHRCPRL
jgi:mRNA interferase MazF